MAFIDSSMMQLIYGLVAAVFAAVLYQIVLKFKDDPNLSQPIDWASLYANIIFGVVAGIVAWALGINVTIEWLGGQIAAFGVIIALMDHIIVGIMNRTVQKAKFVFIKKDGSLLSNPANKTDMKSFLAGAIATMRKMDPGSREFLVFDLPEWAKQPTLNAVDQAELKSTYQYAIQSASWIFLIEDGELTGAKHYWFRSWFGAPILWKPISASTLEACRKTGRIPDYEYLA